jgi:hypothetical protein
MIPFPQNLSWKEPPLLVNNGIFSTSTSFGRVWGTE